MSSTRLVGNREEADLVLLVDTSGNALLDSSGLKMSPTGVNAAATSTEIASTNSDGQVVSAATGLRLCGYSFRENAGATASLILRNGTSTAGTALVYITLAANESVRDWFGDTGKAAASGIFLDMVSGTVIGQVDSKTVV